MMDLGSLQIRPARKSDAATMAALVDIAGEGLPSYFWSLMKEPGQSLIEFGRSRAARDTGAFSFRNGTVAEVEGEVAALLVDYPLDDPYEVGDLSDMPEFIRPLVRLEALAPGSWYVNILAAFPEFRGKGLGARLLAASEQRGRARSCPSMSIIVAGENAGAVRLYKRAGYRERAREGVVDFPGCPHGGDWILMTKELSNG